MKFISLNLLHKGEELLFHSAPPTALIALLWSGVNFFKYDLYLDPHMMMS